MALNGILTNVVTTLMWNFSQVFTGEDMALNGILNNVVTTLMWHFSQVFTDEDKKRALYVLLDIGSNICSPTIKGLSC